MEPETRRVRIGSIRETAEGGTRWVPVLADLDPEAIEKRSDWVDTLSRKPIRPSQQPFECRQIRQICREQRDRAEESRNQQVDSACRTHGR